MGLLSRLIATAAGGVLCALVASVVLAGGATTPAFADAPQSGRDRVVTRIGAHAVDGHVVVSWSTAGAPSVAGFILERRDAQGARWATVSPALVPALIGAPDGGTYAVADTAGSLTGVGTYRLRVVAVGGGSHHEGPYAVSVAGGPPPLALMRQLDSGAHIARAVAGSGTVAQSAVSVPTSPAVSAAATRVRITVNRAGLYRVKASTVASALGANAGAVQSMIKRHGMSLTNRGAAVAYRSAADGSSLYFYGKGVDTIYTGENAYWLSVGLGKPMAKVSVSRSRRAVTRTFPEKARTEKHLVPAPALFHDPETDFWLWEVLDAGTPEYGDKTYAVSVPDVARGASLSVSLHGLTALGVRGEHHVRVSLNGRVLGTGSWTGASAFTLTSRIPSRTLRSGSNSVRLEALLDPGVAYSVLALRAIDVTYSRNCAAVGDQLSVRPRAAGPVRVTRLSTRTAWVFDVSSATRPRIVASVRTGGRRGAAWVQFNAHKARRYLVATPTKALRPASISGVASPGLKAAGRGAEYVVITAPPLLAAAQELATYRGARGLTTTVVTTEDIYDEFSWGVRTPHAITDFIAYACANWDPAPRFVALAGDGSYDYRDYRGFGDSLVPPLMVDTPDGLAASDVRLVSSRSDALPEVAVGRIPVRTGADLSAYVDKVERYEASSGDWRSKVLLVADDADTGGNFPADSDATAALLPASLVTQKAYVGPLTFAAARVQLLDTLDEGALLINYIGHAGVGQLAANPSTGGGLLQKSDVATLAHTDALPVFAMMTCVAGQFALPGYQSLGEDLVTDADGGSIAVLGPTAFEFNYESAKLDRCFVTALFATQSPALGTALGSALDADALAGGAARTRFTYALLGDPALVVDW